MTNLIPTIILLLAATAFALVTAERAVAGQVGGDNGDGTYTNPILFADYSDPDVIRVGEDYYMVNSSFFYMPGIPVLHSKDLVNWRIVGHVYGELKLDKRFDLIDGAHYGHGCWAPSIRHHDGKYWVYFCTPNYGLFMSTAKNPAGPWEPLTHVKNIQDWEDPCPLWDDDGKAYLVRSRRGGGVLFLHEMSPDGKKLLDDGKIIFGSTDKDKQPHRFLEGPKFLKRKGHYYIFAPGGGVAMGYQVVLRSKDIYGPYEDRIVLKRGSTKINGPHQGGYVETPSGEGWFIHFQQVGCYGRIVHLQPVRWAEDWPIMGKHVAGRTWGEPVLTHAKPDVGKTYPITGPQDSDEFDSPALGLQWQWDHNPVDSNWSLTARKGHLRLKASRNGANKLTQKLADPGCAATTELDVSHLRDGEQAGLYVWGYARGWIAVEQADGKRIIRMHHNHGGWRGKGKQFQADGPAVQADTVWLRAHVGTDQKASFAYSLDGKQFVELGEKAPLYFDWWKGSRFALFCFTSSRDKDEPVGHGDFNWFHYEPGKDAKAGE